MKIEKHHIYHHDGGHGWLRATAQEAYDLGIMDKVSKGSYMEDDLVFLEEDADLGLFAKSAFATTEDWKAFIGSVPSTNSDKSFIRYLPQFDASVSLHWCDQRPPEQRARVVQSYNHVGTNDVIEAALNDNRFAKWSKLCLQKHLTGNWGDLGAEDLFTNTGALATKSMVMGSYNFPPFIKVEGQKKLYIITDNGHKTTTMLWPDEY